MSPLMRTPPSGSNPHPKGSFQYLPLGHEFSAHGFGEYACIQIRTGGWGEKGAQIVLMQIHRQAGRVLQVVIPSTT